MDSNIILIKLSELKPHEEIDLNYFTELKDKILKLNFWKWPIVVDNQTKIILDGHHRYNIAQKLGFQKIPAFIVDYARQDIRVISRRNEFTVSKEIIAQKVAKNELFPQKTTNHQVLIEDSWQPIYTIAPETQISFSELI